jgi:FkbM family methyltransferase
VTRGYLSPFQRLLFALSAKPGRVGASAARKLKRRRKRQSLLDFEVRLASLTASDICLDLGANMGVYTEKLALTGAEVHAYEPDPHCFAALQAKFADWPGVHLHNAAVARSAGVATLRRTLNFQRAPDSESQGSSIARQDSAMHQQDGMLVETRAFADVVNGFDRPVAIVKMDIEGSEFEILEDILKAPDQFRIGALFVETHERHFPDRFAMLHELRGLNFSDALPFPIDTFWR